MAVKKIGISSDLIIHPGETIADILEERGITQGELAARVGVTPSFVSSVIAGKKTISASFAMGLEYALGVPKTFWLNLQANYDAELLEYCREKTITEDEKNVRKTLSDIIKYLRKQDVIPEKQSIIENILSLREYFQVSNLCNLKDLLPTGAFRLSANSAVDLYVLGAWLRICQINGEKVKLETEFDTEKTEQLIFELKNIMTDTDCDLQQELYLVLRRYGIHFSVVQNFRGAPVHGYISQNNDNQYHMVLTIRGAFADIFWFSLFHELGHIVNGDISQSKKFIDMLNENKTNREFEADNFARDALIDPVKYENFIRQNDFTISAIEKFSNEQNIMPYIVIGRLQKEKYINYGCYSSYKLRYKWSE